MALDAFISVLCLPNAFHTLIFPSPCRWLSQAVMSLRLPRPFCVILRPLKSTHHSLDTILTFFLTFKALSPCCHCQSSSHLAFVHSYVLHFEHIGSLTACFPMLIWYRRIYYMLQNCSNGACSEVLNTSVWLYRPSLALMARILPPALNSTALTSVNRFIINPEFGYCHQDIIYSPHTTIPQNLPVLIALYHPNSVTLNQNTSANTGENATANLLILLLTNILLSLVVG
jgi:hypothetical protein